MTGAPSPWLSGMELWKRQQRSPGEAEVALALTLLSSLELHLRVDERCQRRLLTHLDHRALTAQRAPYLGGRWTQTGAGAARRASGLKQRTRPTLVGSQVELERREQR